jgi:transposase-like protein
VDLNETATASSSKTKGSKTKGLKQRLEGDTVAVTRMELMELVGDTEGGDVDFLGEGVRVLAGALVEVEVTGQIGAGHGERNPEGRTAQRNGYRDRGWDTRAGTVELSIPRLRTGSSFPRLLDARRRAETPAGLRSCGSTRWR